MTKRVLLVGLKDTVVDDARQKVRVPNLQIMGATGIRDVRLAFAEGRIDHVIMGAGLELKDRLDIVQEIFESSDSTTVHMKDRASGPEGFLPFIQGLLSGLDG